MLMLMIVFVMIVASAEYLRRSVGSRRAPAAAGADADDVSVSVADVFCVFVSRVSTYLLDPRGFRVFRVLIQKDFVFCIIWIRKVFVSFGCKRFSYLFGSIRFLYL